MKTFSFLVVFCALFAHAKELGVSDHYQVAEQTCQTLADIRREIDRLNDEILQLLAERTAYVQRAGDLKMQTTRIADDRQRVADQEKKLIEKSEELGLSTEISLPAFRAIVENSIQFQQAYIDERLALK